MMAQIIGWLSLAVFLVAGILLACYYHRVWHDWFHMSEPFTFWFCKLAVSYPFAWWGTIALFTLIALLTAIFGVAWQRVLGVIWTGFFVWFIWHIIMNIKSQADGIYAAIAPKIGALKASRNLGWFKA